VRDPLDSLGESVRDLRVLRGWTQQQLAAHAGVSQPAVSRVENGQPANTTTVAAIAHAFGVEIRLETE
jgi:transcriptional regulator with XRE-family HTH domain